MAEQNTPPAVPEKIDVAQVKTMLNLPETATDIETIQALVALIGGLQAKYDALLADAVEMEDTVANRDLQDFENVITPDAKDFWKEQLLRNRVGTLNVLAGIRQAQETRLPEPQPEPQPDPEKRTLFRNRLINPVRTMSELADETPAANINRAVKIRNRAQELRSQEKIPYALAFTRAEKEIE